MNVKKLPNGQLEVSVDRRVVGYVKASDTPRGYVARTTRSPWTVIPETVRTFDHLVEEMFVATVRDGAYL